MRKQLFRSICLGGLSAIGLVLWQQQPSSAADDVKTINIVKVQGQFGFDDRCTQIDKGQTVKWVPTDAGVPHHLLPDTPNDAFTDTGEFDASNPPTQKFETAGVIKYHCKIHPRDMKGCIFVK